MPGILKRNRKTLKTHSYHHNIMMDVKHMETIKDGPPDITSPKITDFFHQKPQITSPKPAKSLLNFFSPTKGKEKVEDNTKKQQPSCSSAVAENNNVPFTKIRPSESSSSTGIRDEIKHGVEKSKGKKRKTDDSRSSEQKKRRKERVADNSLDEFDVCVTKKEQEVTAENPKKRKKSKKKSAKKGKRSASKTDDKETRTTCENDVEVEDNQIERGPSNVTRSKVVKLPDLENDTGNLDSVDDTVVSVSYVDFLSEVVDENKKKDCATNTCSEGKGKACDGGHVGRENAEIGGEGNHASSMPEVNKGLVGSESAEKDNHISQKLGQTNIQEKSSEDPVGEFSVDKSAMKSKTNVSQEKDVVDGDGYDGTKQTIKKDKRKKRIGKESTSGKDISTDEKKKKHHEKKYVDTKANDESHDIKPDEPKKTVGIAKFFVQKDSDKQCVVEVDVHSPQPPSPGNSSKERRRSSNVVVNSSDSDSIEEIGMSSKSCDSVSAAVEVKYPAFFFGKKAEKKKTSESESEKPMEVENEHTAVAIAEPDDGKTSVTAPEIREEILIDSSSEGDHNPPSFCSPPIHQKKKTTQMTFNFSGGNFKMEKAVEDDAPVGTSDDESNTEMVEETSEVKAKKSLSDFFTSTPKDQKKPGKDRKKGKKVSDESTEDDIERKVAKRKSPAVKKSGKDRRKGKVLDESTEDDIEGKVVKRKSPAIKKSGKDRRKGKKVLDESTEDDVEGGAVKQKSSATKKKALRKKEKLKVKTPNSKVESESLKNDVQLENSTKKGKRKRVPDSPENEGTPKDGCKRRRALRSMYRSTMVDDVTSPLRIRLTRTGAKAASTSETDETSPQKTRRSTRGAVKAKQNKLSAAQYLIQKARENKAQSTSEKKTKDKEVKAKSKVSTKVKKKSGKGVSTRGRQKSDEENRKPGKERRISKDSDVSVVVIDDEGKKASQKKKKAVTPRKRPGLRSPRKATPKKTGKVAPMFMSKKEKEAALKKEKEIAEEEAKSTKAVDTPEMIEHRRIRDAIIKSGISDEIKQRLKQVEETSKASLDWPLLPGRDDNHVLQKLAPKCGLDLWNLPFRSLPLKDAPVVVTDVYPTFVSCIEKSLPSTVRMPEVPVHTEVFSAEVLQGLLGEVRDNTPGFPVRKMYKSLVSRKLTSEQEALDSVQGIEEDVTIIGDAPVTSQRDARKSSSDSVIVISEDVEQEEIKEKKEEHKTKSRRSGRLRRNKSTDKIPKEIDETSNPKVEPSDQTTEGTNTDTAKKDDKPTKNLLWTDMYQPCSALDIIGNSNAVKKLKTWLTGWKERVDREARKQKILERKEAKKNKNKKGSESSTKWLTDDESDFELSDMSGDDCEDEEITNTMLLTGPHGIGKTSTVYALAHELGYKVFEVNASSRRNGKQVMSQLLEATQSHHVSKANLGTPSTPNKPSPFATKGATIPKAGDEKAKVKPPVNFFNVLGKNSAESESSKKKGSEEGAAKKKGAASKSKRGGRESEVEEKTPKKSTKKRKADEVEEISSAKSKSRREGKGRTPKSKGKPKAKEEVIEVKKPAASISLILFEEVDIVFEEDKGFIQAIQSLMTMTKRPMIMTTTDPRFADQFEGFFEELIYKIPSVVSVASYLQVVCLVEKVRTGHADLLSVVNSCGGDIRQSLLLLQFWISSGGGKETSERTIRLVVKNSDGAKPDSQGSEQDKATQERMKLLVNKVDSDDEFETFTARRKVRRAAPLIESDSSMDSCSLTPQKPKRLKMNKQMDVIKEDSQETLLQAVDDSQGGEKTHSEIPGPVVHLGFYGSTVGPSALVTDERTIFEYLRVHWKNITDFQKHVDLVMHHNKQHKFDLISSNLRHLLPLPRHVAPAPYPQNTSKSKVVTKKFSRIRADWYDSEDSQEGFESLLQKDTTPQDNAKEKEAQCVKNETIPGDVSSNKDSEVLCAASVEALSRHYDNVSFVDAVGRKSETRLGQCGNEFYWNAGNITPGLSDEFCKFDSKDFEKEDTFETWRTSALLLSFHCCCDSLKKVMEKTEVCESKSDLLEKLTLPVQDDVDVLRSCCDFEASHWHSSMKKCAEYVTHNLPVAVQGQTSAVCTDYLPTIRKICKSEEIKEASKLKRRFFHYLDSISFHLKPSVLETLNNTFR